MRRLRVCLAALAALLGAPVFANAADAPPAAAAVDYSQDSAWLCRPGEETTCTTGLDAVAVTGDGQVSPQPFVPAVDPPIDCFYVYPTISQEPTRYSDMAASPEVVRAVRAQAARLTSRCRLFAPIYRQLTFAGMRQDMAGGGGDDDLDRPYRDVAAAWRWYMQTQNHGRGVVLIGHSQGTILLQRLIAEEIDGKPAEARLVSAFLAGDPSLPVPKGGVVGGAFKHVPLCRSAAETGCVYVWASYLADDQAPDRAFGRSPGGGLTAGCTNPAAPAGGAGPLKAYLPKPSLAAASDPPWVEVLGQLSAACVADAQGQVLRVAILPSAFASLLHAEFDHYGLGPAWGLHRLDLSLPQGNILDLVGAETQAWTRR